MRQAGRYMPQYQAVRGEVDFLTLCKTPDLATKVTLLPIDLIKVDAAILFSDILIPLEPMGIDVKFEDKRGPVLAAVQDEAAIKKLRMIESEEDVGFVMDAIRMIRKELEGRVPLIGFSGSPFTLATYAVEGGTTKSFHNIKGLMYSRPELADYLMDLLADVVINYLNAQADAGAQALQIFDTWGGILADMPTLSASTGARTSPSPGLPSARPRVFRATWTPPPFSRPPKRAEDGPTL
jgi:uroporphyrinogen decarboxylase